MPPSLKAIVEVHLTDANNVRLILQEQRRVKLNRIEEMNNSLSPRT